MRSSPHEVLLTKIVHHVRYHLICILEGLHGNFECVVKCPRGVLLVDDALVQKVSNHLQSVASVATPWVMFWHVVRHHLKEYVLAQRLGKVEIHKVA